MIKIEHRVNDIRLISKDGAEGAEVDLRWSPLQGLIYLSHDAVASAVLHYVPETPHSNPVSLRALLGKLYTLFNFTLLLNVKECGLLYHILADLHPDFLKDMVHRNNLRVFFTDVPGPELPNYCAAGFPVLARVSEYESQLTTTSSNMLAGAYVDPFRTDGSSLVGLLDYCGLFLMQGSPVVLVDRTLRGVEPEFSEDLHFKDSKIKPTHILRKRPKTLEVKRESK